MLPFAKPRNARLVLANRRDYPGTTPYSIEERAEVYAAAVEGSTDPEKARTRLLAWMKERGREVYDLLVHIVDQYSLPLARPEASIGGIIVGGLSFAATLMTALLANIASFPIDSVDLRKYLRRIVLLGTPATRNLTIENRGRSPDMPQTHPTSGWASRPPPQPSRS